jgi:V8-like Glu-specific endopeptidase
MMQRRLAPILLALAFAGLAPHSGVADTGPVLGTPRGEISVFTDPDPVLIQALLVEAGIAAERHGTVLEGEIQLGEWSYPFNARIARGVDGLGYLDFTITLAKLAAAQRQEALSIASRVALNALSLKFAVTDDNVLLLRRSFLLGKGFDTRAFVDAFDPRFRAAAGKFALHFEPEGPAHATVGGKGLLTEADARRVMEAAAQETLPVFRSQDGVLQAILRREKFRTKAGADIRDCNWCMVSGAMTHYALVFRDTESASRRIVEIGNAIAPTFNRNRPEFLEIINRFNLTVSTPARAFLANSGDIYLEYAYAVQAGIEPTYAAAIGGAVMPAAAAELMNLLAGEPMSSALRLERDPAAEADATAFPSRLVGRLILHYKDGEAGVCTGSLIGPDVVLTAAHCVRPNAKNGGEADLERGVFQLGYSRGDWVESAAIAEVTTADDYIDQPETVADRRRDWAVIRLAEELPFDGTRIAIRSLDTQQLMQNGESDFFALGYGSFDKRDPGEKMLESRYRLLSWSLPFEYSAADPAPKEGADRILVFAGKAIPGDSGGPVFLREGNKDYLVGIAIAGYSDQYEAKSSSFSPSWRYSPKGDLAFVVPAAEFLDKLNAILAETRKPAAAMGGGDARPLTAQPSLR